MSHSTELPIQLAQRLLLNWLKPSRAHSHIFDVLSLSDFFGCTPSTSKENEEECLVTFQAQIKECQSLFAEKQVSEGSVLEENLNQLCELLRLSPEERQILSYLCIAEAFDKFQQLTEIQEHLSFRSAATQIAECIQLPVRSVFTLLNQNGKLLQSGLVRRRRCHSGGKSFTLVDSELAFHLIEEPFDMKNLTSYLGTKGRDPLLTRSDFQHLTPTLVVLIPYLRASLTNRRKGVNVFIHGVPGTGKSELARLLGKTLDCGTFEPSFIDEGGDPIPGNQRFSRLRCTLSFLKNESTLIVCDEAEDLFHESHSPHQQEVSHKLWINRLLEENEIPVIWLSNRITHLDPAIIRRFDFVFEATIPKRTQRQNIIRKTTGSLLSNSLINSLSANENLAPAIVSRAAGVLQEVQANLSPAALDSAFNLLVTHTLTAQGHPAPSALHGQDELPYDPTLSCSSTNLTELVKGLRSNPTARICLEGPPGTGKTAFAAWLAESLDRELHSRRLSDLLSKFVGDTEKSIAEAFQKAQQEDAVLLLDEVDSLLADRNSAVRSWEVSQVNEMLTQLENFQGLLIATTNRIKSLDAASRRRFDITISLDYLSPQQITQLFQKTCHTLQLSPAKLTTAARALPNAAPGDFAALVRQHRFQPFSNADHLDKALLSLCAEKPDRPTPNTIGFKVV